ncbi:unnamed protein product [Ceratitis capitata]|uniref:(Mediterranean fruit fly) hypothetical protein n=1 Tax=Ceratitis capitata TaxID=7213 RepID=A0A811VIE8_CERCA|nr:unnamed protein product [Ceratitis capitata]
MCTLFICCRHIGQQALTLQETPPKLHLPLNVPGRIRNQLAFQSLICSHLLELPFLISLH